MKKNQRKSATQILVYFIFMATLFVSSYQLTFAQKDGDDVVIGKYRTLYSKVLNEERLIIIHLPWGYEEAKVRYPVLFKLDGDYIPFVSQATATIDIMNVYSQIPSMIMVAVGNTDRDRDMFPVKVKIGQPVVVQIFS